MAFDIGGPVNSNSAGVLTRASVQHPMSPIGVPQGVNSTVTTYYKKRARDSGATGAVYVTWVTTVIAHVYPFTPPFGGPLVDEVIAEWWQV